MTEALLGNSTLYERALATTPFIATQILVLASSTISGHITGQNSIIAGGLEGRLLNPPA
ncbi:hypothetical protein BDV93DRAFT_567381 [Ceratobasidium sp. AG-I]|nr:hypothetical protein BDV93DRAFT_567381 [Ceratobasidium sp. AG-I]